MLTVTPFPSSIRLGCQQREVDEPQYFDFGPSYGDAAFVIGYHYDFSISYYGIARDFLEYAKSFWN